VRKAVQISGEVKLATLKGRLETVGELAAEHTAEHGDGEKEARMGWNPVGVVEGESTGRDDTVDMGMNFELLIPGVQHAEEADVGAEVLGITGPLRAVFRHWSVARGGRGSFCSVGRPAPVHGVG